MMLAGGIRESERRRLALTRSECGDDGQRASHVTRGDSVRDTSMQ